MDVSIDAEGGRYTTSVFRKPTDEGKCLNGSSACPRRYKDSVIKAYVHRALKHCSTWPLLHQELQRIRQILTDNNYELKSIDQEIKTAIERHLRPEETKTNERGESINLFYRSQMTPSHEADESALQNIIKRNCKPANPADRIRLHIYYRSPTTASLIMKNITQKETSTLKQSNVVYHYNCIKGDCALLSTSGYIGYTTTTLSRRLTMHLQNGGPQQHTETQHNTRLTRQEIVKNTKILARATDLRRLVALEAILIREHDPTINRQTSSRGTIRAPSKLYGNMGWTRP